jgi:hypothetical protein
MNQEMKDLKINLRNLHDSHTQWIGVVLTVKLAKQRWHISLHRMGRMPPWCVSIRSPPVYSSIKDGWKEPVSFFVYYESRNRELKTRPIYECRCDERLKTKSEKSTRLVYTGFLGELEHIKVKTRLIDEMFPSVMGEYVFLK